MKTYLFVNDLIKWESEAEDTAIERILWIDPDHVLAFVININERQCVPEARKVEDILFALENGLAKKWEEDPWAKFLKEEEIDPKYIKAREEAWKVIASIVSDNNKPEVYYRNARRKFILDASKEFGVSDRVIYKYLTKYWQRGSSLNALLPDYNNSGGRGKSKTPKEKKLGRPRKNVAVIGAGINTDEATKRIFRVAISRFYDNSKENSFTTAYHLMLKEYYAEDYTFDNGIKKPILVPASDIPTIEQFKYWYEKEKNINKSTRARKGLKKFELEHRAVTGRSDAELMGPGSLYQIDATVADVYLVSRHNRNWIIGRPVVYVVIDAFTREITGLYVGLEGPSWIGAMMALANAFSDKEKYCSEYGITISEEEWPCHHLPMAILGDRGELEGKMPETLITALGVRIANTPSFRADWKGIVEQHFRLLDIHVKPLVPGHIDTDFRERGGKDYRLDAKLDIYQFTQIIINSVLYYNNQHWMNKYETNEMMINDDIDPIPRVLWEWGIRNRSGKLKSYPEDIVKLNLMPAARATVTEKGIKFKNMFYSCDKAIEEMWFEKARNKRGWKENVSYDPRNMDYVYVRSEDGKSFEKCFLLDKRRYSSKTLDEINYLDAFDQLKKEKDTGNRLQSKVDLFSDIESIVSEAEKMTNEQQDKSISKTSRIKSIRQHRKEEKLENRKTEAFDLGTSEGERTSTESKVIPIVSDSSGEDLSYPNHIAFLRKKQKERMGKKDE